MTLEAKSSAQALEMLVGLCLELLLGPAGWVTLLWRLLGCTSEEDQIIKCSSDPESVPLHRVGSVLLITNFPGIWWCQTYLKRLLVQWSSPGGSCATGAVLGM